LVGNWEVNFQFARHPRSTASQLRSEILCKAASDY
jgi:hypothetical protein